MRVIETSERSDSCRTPIYPIWQTPFLPYVRNLIPPKEEKDICSLRFWFGGGWGSLGRLHGRSKEEGGVSLVPTFCDRVSGALVFCVPAHQQDEWRLRGFG